MILIFTLVRDRNEPTRLNQTNLARVALSTLLENIRNHPCKPLPVGNHHVS